MNSEPFSQYTFCERTGHSWEGESKIATNVIGLRLTKTNNGVYKSTLYATET